MSLFTRLMAEIFRDYETDKVPSSGAHKPIKSEIRLWGAEAEAALALVETAIAADTSSALTRLELARRSALFTRAV